MNMYILSLMRVGKPISAVLRTEELYVALPTGCNCDYLAPIWLAK